MGNFVTVVACPHFSIGPATTNQFGSTLTIDQDTFRCSICDALAENELSEGERFAITAADPKTGARYLFLTKRKGVAISRTIVISDSINVDLDENDDVVGVEIL